jgi:RNA polymerase sigma-70 factor, ECF subfamily
MYPVDVEEADLIRRLQAGDDEAFEMMVRLYGSRMLTIARRFLRVEQDARDAVQEALLSVFRSIGEFSGQSRLSTWLHRIVVNAALMQIRSRKSQRESSIEELLPHFDDEGSWLENRQGHYNFGEQHLEERETRELVRRCIARLPDNYRSVLLMRDIEDRDYGQIAALIEARPGTVKIRVHRARQALRCLISKELVDRSELGLNAIHG